MDGWVGGVGSIESTHTDAHTRPNPQHLPETAALMVPCTTLMSFSRHRTCGWWMEVCERGDYHHGGDGAHMFINVCMGLTDRRVDRPNRSYIYTHPFPHIYLSIYLSTGPTSLPTSTVRSSILMRACVMSLVSTCWYCGESAMEAALPMASVLSCVCLR